MDYKCHHEIMLTGVIMKTQAFFFIPDALGRAAHLAGPKRFFRALTSA
jgi:hypothetical protein